MKITTNTSNTISEKTDQSPRSSQLSWWNYPGYLLAISGNDYCRDKLTQICGVGLPADGDPSFPLVNYVPQDQPKQQGLGLNQACFWQRSELGSRKYLPEELRIKKCQ